MEKSIEDIIEELAKGKVVEELIKNMKISIGETRENLEDLAQDIYIDIMEKDSEIIKGLEKRGELKYYLTKIIMNNIHSQSSPYYTKYKKFKTEEYDKYE